MNKATMIMVANYATVRDAVEETKAKMKEMIDNVKQSDEYARLESWLSINQQSLAELDSEIRSAALADYMVTGNKKPFEGVAVKEMTKYDYTLEDAVEWSKANAPMLVYETVDKKKFEKVISVTPPELLSGSITIYKEPMATIASDLSFAKAILAEVQDEQRPE